MSRTVTLALLDRRGSLLGALAPYQVNTPWWQEVEEIVAGARQHHGVDVTVLRLLGADRPAPPGGHVRYLATVDSDPAAPAVLTTSLDPSHVDLSPHPHRAAWAEPGGPHSSLAWAREVLAAAGRPAGELTQMRTWNLSALWRVDTAAGFAWLKQVPEFFAHEEAVLRWLGGNAAGMAPELIAASGARLLLEHIAGSDRHDATPAERFAMLADLHAIQVRAAEQVEELLGVGVPDRRPAQLTALVRTVLADRGGSRLDGLLADLDDRLAALAACGVPDTLVHGDFHPGNVRGDGGERRTILDWGDSVIGHPAFDLLRMCDDKPELECLRAEWCRWWREAVPGCEPERALALIGPVDVLRNAAVYATFLDAIEPAEWPYHAGDVRYWLDQAAATVGSARM